MKKITLIFMLAVFPCSLFAQHVFHDAQLLKKYSVTDSRGITTLGPIHTADAETAKKEMDTILTVLSRYFPGVNATTSPSQFDAMVAGNAYFSTISISGASRGSGPSYSILSALSSGSSVGGVDVTAIADGFARFIVKRTKEELSIAFFEKFKTALDDNKDFQLLFPKTYRSLQAIGSEIYNFKAYIQTLREAFESDLSALPDNLPDLIESHQAFFDSKPDLKATLLSGFYIAKGIKDGTHPGEIIELFPVSEWDGLADKNYVAAFKTIQLVSTSLRDSNSNGNYWMASAEIRKLATDDTLLKLYLGLLSEKAKQDGGISYTLSGGTTTLFAVLQSNATHLQSYRNFFSGLSLKTKSIESQLVDLKTGTDSLRYEKYYRLVSDGLDVMDYVVANQELLGIKKSSVNLDQLTEPYFTTTQAIADLAIDVNRRKYASVIVALMAIIDKNLAGETTRPDTKLLFKYGSFMAAMADARNSEEVEAIIEAFALPAGSARIKRETDFSVSINSYCGLFYGGENIKGIDHGYKGTFGVTAPIGIAISAGKTKFLSKKAHASHSLFLSLVDLGAVTAFRFTDDTTESVPKIELKDIISPGIFYSFGIAGTPLSMNFGYQVGPLLRTVKETENDYSNSYSRISVSLVVDIPLLNLYTKTK